MIVYEVTAVVECKHCDAYERYMKDEHIPDVLATGFFEGASFECSASGRYRVCYRTRTREDLDKYLSGCAPRLRADFKTHFPVGIELAREEWEVIGSFA